MLCSHYERHGDLMNCGEKREARRGSGEIASAFEGDQTAAVTTARGPRVSEVPSLGRLNVGGDEDHLTLHPAPAGYTWSAGMSTGLATRRLSESRLD